MTKALDGIPGKEATMITVDYAQVGLTLCIATTHTLLCTCSKE
jgi:hypothetical protein